MSGSKNAATKKTGTKGGRQLANKYVSSEADKKKAKEKRQDERQTVPGKREHVRLKQSKTSG